MTSFSLSIPHGRARRADGSPWRAVVLGLAAALVVLAAVALGGVGRNGVSTDDPWQDLGAPEQTSVNAPWLTSESTVPRLIWL